MKTIISGTLTRVENEDFFSNPKLQSLYSKEKKHLYQFQEKVEKEVINLIETKYKINFNDLDEIDETDDFSTIKLYSNFYVSNKSHPYIIEAGLEVESRMKQYIPLFDIHIKKIKDRPSAECSIELFEVCINIPRNKELVKKLKKLNNG